MPTLPTLHQRAGKHDVPEEHHVHRTGDWLPNDHRINHEWLGHQVEQSKQNPKELSPALKEFKEFIENTPRVYMWFHSMFDELPVKSPYNKDPTGKKKQIRDYKHMLEVLNHVFTQAPHWTDSAYHVGMVGVPVNAVLNWPMGTASGYAAFLDPEVNAHLKKVLNEWGKFLASPKSAEVLGDHVQGWFSTHGTEDVMAVANAPYKTSHQFHDFFECDPQAKHHGYKSWDDYFTRRFKPAVRPIADPDNDDVIISACESKPYNLQRNAHLRDRFWIKNQPYSVADMLAHDPLAQEFAGATVYQAFLSALSYHRWHMPVSGTIKKAYVVDGTYFSEPLFEGLGDRDTEGIAPNGIATCQGYLSALAARAIIFIEADNPKIGLMAFIGIGMDEVSTCDITATVGQHYKKGDETGMFHFGGSTHCLLFRKGVNVEGFPEPGQETNVPVRSKIAVVKS